MLNLGRSGNLLGSRIENIWYRIRSRLTYWVKYCYYWVSGYPVDMWFEIDYERKRLFICVKSRLLPGKADPVKYALDLNYNRIRSQEIRWTLQDAADNVTRLVVNQEKRAIRERRDRRANKNDPLGDN